MSSLNIRLATLLDVPKILAAQEAIGEAPHWSVAHYEEILRPNASLLRRHVWVAISGKELVGFAVMGILLGEAEIESIAVMPVWRMKGVGRLLLATTIRSAREVNVTDLRLEVRQSNLTAQRFYTQLGFEARDVRRGYYSKPPEDAVLMSLTLRYEP